MCHGSLRNLLQPTFTKHLESVGCKFKDLRVLSTPDFKEQFVLWRLQNGMFFEYCCLRGAFSGRGFEFGRLILVNLFDGGFES